MSAPELSEQDLIKKAVKGDSSAYELLILQNQDRLFNSLFRMTGNFESAEDFTQETFIKAYRALASFKGDCSFYTWLYRIALNTVRSSKRSIAAQSAGKHVSIHAFSKNSDGDEAPLDIVDDSPSPLEKLSGAELGRSLQKAILTLDEDFRTVIVLRDVENHEYEDIANMLECNMGTVKSRLHRARARLAEILIQEGHA